MHNHKRIPTEKIPKNKKTAFYSGILSISLFGVLALPATLSAFTYDDYLLATEKAGKTLAEGISAGADNTKALYGTALSSLDPSAYFEYSNNLGTSFANTLTQGMGASYGLSQKIWKTDPYSKYVLFSQNTGNAIAQRMQAGGNTAIAMFANIGDAFNFSVYLSFGNDMGGALADNVTRYVSMSNFVGESLAGGMKDGFANSRDLYAQSFRSAQQLFAVVPRFDLKAPQGRTLPVQLASLTDIWNNTTNYFSNLWNNVTTPTPKQPTTNNLPPTTVKPPATKPLIPSVAPKPASPPTPPPTKNYKPLTTNSSPSSPQQLVVERTVERVLSGLTSADLESRIEQLRNELVSKIGSVSTQSQSNYSNNFQAIALTNKIDQLTNTVITTPTITGGTLTNASISGGSISGATISGTTLTVSSGTFSGNLTVSGTATSTFAGDSAFDTNTLYIDSLNNRVGVGTSSPSDTLSVNGPVFLANSSPSITANRLYSSSNNLYWAGSLIGGATTGTWDTDGTHVWRPTGNVGIGTTSPYAKLSVVGEVVASNFTATSTTATTTLAGGFVVETSGLVYDYSSNNIGIGTAAPTSKLHLTSSSATPVYFETTATGNNSVLTLNNTNGGGNAAGLALQVTSVQRASIFSYDTGLNIQTDQSLPISFNINGVNRKMLLDTTGNLGIGTTSPYAKLSVVGETVSSYFTATSTTASIFPYASSTALTVSGSLFTTLTANSVPFIGTNGLLTQNTDQFIWDNTNFRLGVGTTTPNANLTLQGTTAQTQNLFNIASSTGASLVSVDSGGGLTINRGTMSAAGNTLFSVSGTRVVGNGLNDILTPVAGFNADLSVTPTVTDADFFGNTLSTEYTAVTVGYTGGIIGSKNSATVNIGNPNTVSAAYGSYNMAYLANSGTVTTAVGSLGRVYSVIGTIANAYGFRSQVNLGSATNAYGLYVNAISGATNSYAIYTAGASDKSYFAGNVGIGTTTPNNKLDIYSTTKSAIGFSGASGDTYKWTIGMDVSNGGRFSIASSTALGTLDRFVIDGNGNVGIGTTSPYAKLTVWGSGTGTNQLVNFVNNASTTLWTLLENGNVGIGTTSPWTTLSVNGSSDLGNFGLAGYFTATSTTATTTISGGLNVGNGAIMYDYSSGVASVGNLELGSLNFDTNAGTVSWMDMPVTSSATVGTVESYSAQLDGTALITAYSQSDGAGNIKLSAVGIGTTTPTARLTVTTATTTENIPLFTVASSTGATLFTILNSGYTGIGTTTSAVNNALVVQGGVCITAGTTCPTVSSGSLSLDTAGAGGGNPGVFDIAERYPASEVMETGEIAALDIDTEDTAVIKKGAQGDVLLGIVSTKAAIGINGSTLVLAPDYEATSTKPLIALAGRVPVKISMEGGAIKKGDRITASSVAGIGMKATTTAQQTVGVALAKQETDGTVLVIVQTSTSRLDPAISQGAIVDGNGESSFWSVEDITGRIKFISTGIDLNDQDIVSVRAIIGSAGKWSIDASGRLAVNEVQTNKLCVGETCVTQDEFKKVFGGSQAAQVSITPPPTQDTAPSSTPPVIEETPPLEEPTDSETNPASNGAGATEPEPAAEPEPVVAPESAPEPATEPELVVAPEAAPTLELAPAPEPQPESTPASDSTPVPEPSS